MTPRPSRRLVRVALAASGLGLAALVVAPGALATSSNTPATLPAYAGSIVPPPSAGTVVPPTVTPVKHHKHSRSVTRSSTKVLAYTGAEVGGAAALGLVLVAAGGVMVRGARRPGAMA